MDLKNLGWNNFFENHFHIFKAQGLIAGRVFKEARHLYMIYTSEGVVQAEVCGHFHYTAIEKSDYPTVGDWVVLRNTEGTSLIEKVLPREKYFSRKSAGNEIEEQIVAANIDYLCIVSGLDGGRNFNLRGIERYIAMTIEGGAKPVIILNKIDLATDREKSLKEASTVAGDIPIYMVSALTGEGIENLSMDFPKGSTIGFTGQSGVGKSSLINSLLGTSDLKTGGLRQGDLRGKHTTTHKELFFLKSGAMVIDTPGMRELQLWGNQESLDQAFDEISEAAKGCRFKDCTHQGEPGCAVEQLLKDGKLSAERYENYLSMRAELKFLESKVSERGRLERKSKEKELSKIVRNIKRVK